MPQLLVPPGNEDVRPLARQGAGRRKADAGRTSSDYRDLAVERAHRRLSIARHDLRPGRLDRRAHTATSFNHAGTRHDVPTSTDDKPCISTAPVVIDDHMRALPARPLAENAESNATRGWEAGGTAGVRRSGAAWPRRGSLRRCFAAGVVSALALVMTLAHPATAQTVTLQPASGPPGSTFTATATLVCDVLTVSWDKPVQTFEAKNTASLTGVVPKGSSVGPHTVSTSCSGTTGGSQGATGCFGSCPSTTAPPPLASAFQALGSAAFLVTEPVAPTTTVLPTTVRETIPSTTVRTTTTVRETIPSTTSARVTTIPGTTAPPVSVGLTTVMPSTLAPTTTIYTIADESSGNPEVLLAIAASVLAIAIAGLVRRLLAPRRRSRTVPPSAAVPPVPLRSRTLPEVADALLGTARADALALAGPSAARFAESCGNHSVATPLLATVFWDACVRDQRFPTILRRAGASERACSEGQLVVVRHAGGTRHDLLVLDPGFTLSHPRATRLDFTPSFDRPATASPLWRELIHTAAEPWLSVDDRLVERAVVEVGEAMEFGVIVAAPPRALLTHCPSPAWGVGSTDSAVAAATAGAVVVRQDGSVAVTTALHAVKGVASVTVGGRRGRIVSAHEPTDSCLIALDDLPVDDARRGMAGVLQGVSPRQNEHAGFDGIGSGTKGTTVTAWDLSILAVQNYIGSKVYTSPDTVPGDSGAALIDSADQIMGFAVYRSAFGEPIEYSAWVWADQVFGAHAVRPLGSKAVAQ